LKDLSLLRIVNLEFNPISQLPYYRCHVASILPQIRILDSREITPQERNKAAVVLKKEEVTLEKMFRNECLIAKLSKGIEAVQHQDELRARVIKRLRAAGSKLQTRNMLDLWEMHDFFSEDDRYYVYEMLRKEVRKIYNIRSFGGGMIKDNRGKGADPWEICYSEVLLHQKTRIAELLFQLENESERLIKSIEESKEGAFSDRSIQAEGIRRTMSFVIDGIREEIGDVEKFQPILQELEPKEQVQTLSRDPYGPLSYATTLVHSLPPKQNEPGKEPKRVKIQVPKPSPSAPKAPAVAPVPISNVVTEPKHIQPEVIPETVRVELITEQQALHSINAQLKTKLEQFKTCNEENVHRAQQERTRLHNEIDSLKTKLLASELRVEMSTKEIDRLRVELTKAQERPQVDPSLDRELKKTQYNVTDLEAKLASAQKEAASATAEAEYLKRVAADYGKELKMLFANETKVETAEEHNRRRILRIGLRKLKQATIISQYADNLRNSFTLTSNVRLVVDTLAIWRMNTKYRHLAKKNRKSTLISHFKEWRNQLERLRFERAVGASSDLKMKKNFMTKWQNQLREVRMAARASHIGENFQFQIIIPKYFTIWRELLARRQKKQKEEDQRVEFFKELLMVRRMFRAWRKVARETIGHETWIRTKIETRMRETVFLTWQEAALTSIQHRKNDALSTVMYQKTILKRFVQQWRDTYQNTIHYRNLEKEAEKRYLSRLKQNCFHAWNKLTQQEKYRKVVHVKAFDHYFTRLYSKYLQAWKLFHNLQLEKRKRVQVAVKNYQRIVLHRWKCKLSSVKKTEEMEQIASVKNEERNRKLAVRALRAWRQTCLQEARIQSLGSIFQTRWERTIKRRVVRKWFNQLWKKTRKKIKYLASESRILRTSVQDKSERITDFDRENIQVVQQLHEMTADLAQYRIRLGEKEEEVMRLRGSVEESGMVENSLRDELEMLKETIQRKDVEIVELKQYIEKRDKEYQEKIVQIEKAEELATSIIRESNVKQDAIERAEKEAKSMEESHKDLQSRLSSALDIISSLRTLMEEKEKKHNFEIATIHEQLNVTKQKYERDLLHEPQNGFNFANYVQFQEDEIKYPTMMQTSPIRTPSSDVTSSSYDSSLLDAKSFDLDDEIDRLRSQIRQRMSAA
jgi:hypothetical protein